MCTFLNTLPFYRSESYIHKIIHSNYVVNPVYILSYVLVIANEELLNYSLYTYFDIRIIKNISLRMLETDDGWSIPTSSTLSEISDEIDIIVDSKGGLPEKLTSLNSLTRKQGLRPFQEPDHFNTLFSSICHYKSAAESLQDQIWDLMKRAMKLHFKENLGASLVVLKKSSFLLCKLMDETIKKSIDGKKASAVLEDRFENCCIYLQKLLKRKYQYFSSC